MQDLRTECAWHKTGVSWFPTTLTSDVSIYRITLHMWAETRAQCPLLLSDFNKILNLSAMFRKSLPYQISYESFTSLAFVIYTVMLVIFQVLRWYLERGILYFVKSILKPVIWNEFYWPAVTIILQREKSPPLKKNSPSWETNSNAAGNKFPAPYEC